MGETDGRDVGEEAEGDGEHACADQGMETEGSRKRVGEVSQLEDDEEYVGLVRFWVTKYPTPVYYQFFVNNWAYGMAWRERCAA